LKAFPFKGRHKLFSRDHKVRIVVGGLHGPQRAERIEALLKNPEELERAFCFVVKLLRKGEKP